MNSDVAVPPTHIKFTEYLHSLQVVKVQEP